MKISKALIFTALLSPVIVQISTRVSLAVDQDVVVLDPIYQGPWVTTNRKLNGILNCQLKQLVADRWQGHFWGTWEHVPLDYTVEFGRNNPTAKDGGRLVSIGDKSLADGIPVAGKATIDGAHYDWIGMLTPTEFDIQFTGSRYEGHLEMKRVAAQLSATVAQP
jgi:hypothetical protein